MKKLPSFVLLLLLVFPGLLQAQDPVVSLLEETALSEEFPEPIPKSPEEDCFLELKKIVESDSTFNTKGRQALDLNSVRKSNGSNQRSSQSLSLNSYNDFLGYSQLEIPKGNAFGFNDRNLPKYPHNLADLEAEEKFPGNNVYKANKPHIAPILHTDGTSTPVGLFDGHVQYIDGYYVDTRVLTFGKQLPNFHFPVRTRESVEASTGLLYPTGLPYDDFREYLMYFHHISPSKEPDADKRFLSCGLVKTDPVSNNLTNFSVNNYFGNSFNGSYYLVDDEAPIETIDGHKFVKASVAIKGIDLDQKDFFTFHVVALAYDNGSDFLNETITFPLQEQAMTDPAGHEDMRQTIADFLKLNMDDEIDQGVEMSIVGASQTDIASVFQRLQANIVGDNGSTDPVLGGGMALEGGVPFHIYNEISNIEDPVLREYMKVALVPGYTETFEYLSYEELPPFLAVMKNCPVTFEQKVDNVVHAISRVGGGANLTQDNVEYKNIEFGSCVVPVRDSRLRKIEEQNVYQTELFETYDTQLDQNITDVKALSIDEMRALEEEARIFEEEKERKINTYTEAANVFNVCGYELLDSMLALDRGDVTQEAFEAKSAAIREECNKQLSSTVETLPEEEQVLAVFEEDIKEQFKLLEPVDSGSLDVVEFAEGNQADPSTEKKEPEMVLKDNSMYFVVSLILVFLGCILLIAALLHKKEK